MKLLVFLLLFCICHECFTWRFFHRGRLVEKKFNSPIEDEAGVEELWFEQKLDHFTPGDVRTWKQRYYVNNQFYNGSSKGPVFLMIGGEGEATIKWMTKGAWIDYAQKFNALCFQVEHRYYGKSHPTEDLSTESLQYLTSEQALADLAYFISAMMEKYDLSIDMKLIAFGGSYPGSLAAWLRLKYPHFVHGAMSASGPLLAQVDFQNYFKVVEESLNTYSKDCTRAVQEGTGQVEILLRHMVGQRNLNSKFKLCDPIEKSINNHLDISNLFETLSGNFAGIVQYNKDNRNDSKTKNITIDTLCSIMVNQTMGPAVTRLAAVNDLILNISNQTCLDYKYDKMIEEMRNISWKSEVSEGGRQWTYQTCNEFGFYQTSSHQPQIFGDAFPVDFFTKQCGDIFGPKFNGDFLNMAVERTNTLYGGLDIEVSNVVFVHGSIDPWHALGITKTRNPTAPAIFINGTAHCANMYPSSDTDLPQLVAARKQISELIHSWILK